MSNVPDEVDDLRGPIRELREYSRGNLDVEHDDVHPHAGLVEDPDLRDVLTFLAEVYDPTDEMPASFWDTKIAKRLTKKLGTEAAAVAVEQGDANRAAFLTGVPSYSADVSGMDAIDDLAEWLVESEKCKLIYMAALMGRGKTSLAVRFLEIVDRHYRRLRRFAPDEMTDEIADPEFAANFRVEPAEDDVYVRLIDSWPQLQGWAEQGSSDDDRWFIFDEASTELTAQSGANAQDVAETMGPFVKKMRKCGINMIVIGHDKRDVHPAIRSMADFVDKTGLKSASFYAGIKKREPTGHLFDVEGIPDASWWFDTDDMASWSWGDEHEESEGYSEDEIRALRNERIASLYDVVDDVTQSDLATAFGVSPATVSRAIRESTNAETATQARANDD